MQVVLGQVKIAVRSMARYPLVALVAIVTIALGVGANTAIFSFINGIMLRPLPYPEPGQLVMVWTAFPEDPIFSISAAEYLDYQTDSQSYAAVGAYTQGPVTVTGAGQAERRSAVAATRSLFEVLAIPPRLGRSFDAEEEQEGGPNVILLDHGYWTSHFGAAPDAVGRTVTINDDVYEIVGVLPQTFRLPNTNADFYLPLPLDRTQMTNRSGHNYTAIGRLEPGSTVETARAELRAILPRWQEDYAGLHANDPVDHPLVLVPLEQQLFGAVRPMLWALLGAVALVLLLATANVANLLLARGQARRCEFGVRAALGARRRDLVGQLMLESLVLAGIGGVAGLGVGLGLTRLFRAFAPGGIPRIDEVTLDWRVLGFSAVVTLATGLLFGILPALQISRGDPNTALSDGGRGGSTGRESGRTLRLLVVAQMTLAVTLVAGAGVLIKSFVQLRGVDPGFETTQRISFRVQVMQERYPERENKLAFYGRLRENLAALPGVRDVALVRGLPMVSGIGTEGMAIEGRAPSPDGRDPSFDLQIASDGYFELMGIPVVEGRAFRVADTATAPGVVLINESAARAYFPDSNPVGKRAKIRFAPRDWPLVTIVGVVGDVHQRALNTDPRPELYLPPGQVPPGWNGVMQSLTVALHTDLPLERLAPSIRKVVSDLDPSVPISGLGDVDQAVAGNLATERFSTLLLALFAGLALLIAAIGVYGVMAFSVAQRTREFGIRMALGAEPGRVLRSVLRSTLILTTTGALTGLAVATLATGALESLVFQVGVRDPSVFVISALALAAVALIASVIPARRAASVHPMDTLRAE